MRKTVFLSFFFLLAGFATKALAVCTVNGVEIPCSEFPWWIFIIIGVVGLTGVIFWVIMLVDVVKNEQDKALWIILLFVLGLLGAIIYYFARKRGRAQLPNLPQ